MMHKTDSEKTGILPQRATWAVDLMFITKAHSKQRSEMRIILQLCQHITLQWLLLKLVQRYYELQQMVLTNNFQFHLTPLFPLLSLINIYFGNFSKKFCFFQLNNLLFPMCIMVFNLLCLYVFQLLFLSSVSVPTQAFLDGYSLDSTCVLFLSIYRAILSIKIVII